MKDLIAQLSLEDPDLPVNFSGLDFYRLKDRGGCLQIEFNQTLDRDDNSLIYIINHSLSYITAIDPSGNSRRFDIREEPLHSSADCDLDGTVYTVYDPKKPAIGFTFELVNFQDEYFVKYVDNNGIPDLTGKGILKGILKALSALYKKGIYSSTNHPGLKLYPAEGLVPEMLEVWKKWEMEMDNIEFLSQRQRFVFRYYG